MCLCWWSQGAELFSNYGLLSNEKLLYAYGFATPDNLYDSIAVKLKVARKGPTSSSSSSSASSGEADAAVNMGVFYIQSGGVNGVPPVLRSASHLLI